MIDGMQEFTVSACMRTGSCIFLRVSSSAEVSP